MAKKKAEKGRVKPQPHKPKKTPRAEKVNGVIHLTRKGGKFESLEVSDAQDLADALNGVLKPKGKK